MITLSKELILQHIEKDGMDKFLSKNSSLHFMQEHTDAIKTLLQDDTYGLRLVHLYDGGDCSLFSKDFIDFAFKCIDMDETVPTNMEYPVGEMPNIAEIIGNKTITRRVDIVKGSDYILKGNKCIHMSQKVTYTGQVEIMTTTSEKLTMFPGEKEIVIALVKDYESHRIFAERSATSTKPEYSLHILMPGAFEAFTESEEN